MKSVFTEIKNMTIVSSGRRYFGSHFIIISSFTGLLIFRENVTLSVISPPNS